MSGVIWITGLSGVGKSALAAAVVARLRRDGTCAALLDGDDLRVALGAEVDAYDRASRRRLAEQYARLAQLLAAQGITVVAAVIALFHEIHALNRASGRRYLEVWLRAAEEERVARARGELALGARVGRDIAPEFPREPHLVFDNDYREATLARLVERVRVAWLAP